MDKKTSAVHKGIYQDKTFDSVTTPIYPTSNFAFQSLGQHKGYDYTRSGNPTRAALEENLAFLEGGTGCVATATGMAAVTAVMFLLKPGDHVVTGDDIYGGTYRLFDQVLRRWGIDFSFVNMQDVPAIRSAIKETTRMIWIETPSNPLLHIVDLKATLGLAREQKILTVVDNTFLTPCFQRPFDFGADVVVHSTTKYLNGHSDVVGGAVIFKDEELGERLKYNVNGLGLSEGPFDAWLVLRGVKTLSYRMEAHQANAQAVAEFLEQHPKVKQVYYPGLASHPQKALIDAQMQGYGGIVSFELDTQAISLETFFGRLKYFLLAESLGGVESLIEQPWSMSHASMGESGLKASGITERTVRISVGIEAAQDLLDDLAQGLG